MAIFPFFGLSVDNILHVLNSTLAMRAMGNFRSNDGYLYFIKLKLYYKAIISQFSLNYTQYNTITRVNVSLIIKF